MGIVSLAHRISGLILFISIPFFIYLLDSSVVSAEGFNWVIGLFDLMFFKLVLVLFCWSLAHHFFAGVRFLLIDADVGIEKNAARFSAWLVIVLELLVVLWILKGLFA